jgi:hypothetical protein
MAQLVMTQNAYKLFRCKGLRIFPKGLRIPLVNAVEIW